MWLVMGTMLRSHIFMDLSIQGFFHVWFFFPPMVFCGYFTWLIFKIFEWLFMGRRLCFQGWCFIFLHHWFVILYHIFFIQDQVSMTSWGKFSFHLVKLFSIKYNVGFGVNLIFHINFLFPFFIFLGIRFNIHVWWLIVANLIWFEFNWVMWLVHG